MRARLQPKPPARICNRVARQPSCQGTLASWSTMVNRNLAAGPKWQTRMRGPLLMLAALALIAGPSAVARSRAVTPSSDSGVDVRILRPVPLDTPPPTVTLTYRADPRGQFMIMAETNGAPVRFLVDTGATLVALTTRAAGIDLRNLVFDQVVRTSNGSIPAASVLLREIASESSRSTIFALR